MDLFTQIKMGVSVKEAAEYYGLEVNRGSMVCCPFHNDRTPSMKLNEEYFWQRRSRKRNYIVSGYTERRKRGRLPMVDEWSGFAALLANLIEKYALVLNLDALPDLVIEEAVPEKDGADEMIHENDIESAKAA